MQIRRFPPENKGGLHPRNRHAAGYDFPALVQACPDLSRHVQTSPAGRDTIEFADPAAVKALNQALLKHHYRLAEWDIPPGHLCPPIPSRADYIHHLADLLGEDNEGVVPRGPAVVVLDIGMGTNGVYPIIGVSEYGWRFVGTDIDRVAIGWARRLVAANPSLAGRIECRLQHSATDVFKGVVNSSETFAASMCNPPFHASPEEAAAGTLRKLKNLGGGRTARPVLNFGGRSGELWCRGGESGFVRRMIAQSAERPALCRWFTTLVSKRDSLPAICRTLEQARAAEVRTIDMVHGQKKSRIVAWRFA